MNEIRFKAWHKEQRKMYSADELGEDQLTIMPDGRGFANISGNDTRLSQIDNYKKMIPLQYIGKRDESSTEIYVSDIVRLWGGISAQGTQEYNYVLEVKLTGACLMALEEAENIEIIGNAHETPELLSKEVKHDSI